MADARDFRRPEGLLDFLDFLSFRDPRRPRDFLSRRALFFTDPNEWVIFLAVNPTKGLSMSLGYSPPIDPNPGSIFNL